MLKKKKEKKKKSGVLQVAILKSKTFEYMYDEEQLSLLNLLRRSEYVIRICDLIDFGLDWLRGDQVLPFTLKKDNFATNLKASNFL